MSKKRNLSPYSREKKIFPETSPTDKKGIISTESILKSLDMLTAAQKQKTREILNKIEVSDVIGFNETGELTVNKNSTKIALSTFLYNLQQPNKNLSDPAYSLVSKELQLNPILVPTKNAKSILNPLTETMKKTGKRKASSPTFWDASDEEFEENTKDETSSSITWTTL